MGVSIWTRIRDLFAPRITISKTYTAREMTPDEADAFDELFVHFEATHSAMQELSRRLAANRGRDRS